ncbi:hypothetical protein BVRB_026450, partial [Beta vulgaris subsp. vulgaris]
ESTPLPELPGSIAVEVKVQTLKQYSDLWPIPAISDFSCASRNIRCVSREELPEQFKDLALSAAELEALSDAPLAGAIDLSASIMHQSRSESGLSMVPDELSFDISRHPEAQSAVARSLLDRLGNDLKLYADFENKGMFAKFRPIVELEARLLEKSCDEAVADVGDLYSVVEGLGVTLEALRFADSDYVRLALESLIELSNKVEDPSHDVSLSRCMFIFR